MFQKRKLGKYCGISNIQPPYARLKWLEEGLSKQSPFPDAYWFRGLVYEAYAVFHYQHSHLIDRNASQHGGDLFASMMDEWNLLNGEMKTVELLIGQSAITWPE